MKTENIIQNEIIEMKPNIDNISINVNEINSFIKIKKISDWAKNINQIKYSG